MDMLNRLCTRIYNAQFIGSVKASSTKISALSDYSDCYILFLSTFSGQEFVALLSYRLRCNNPGNTHYPCSLQHPVFSKLPNSYYFTFHLPIPTTYCPHPVYKPTIINQSVISSKSVYKQFIYRYSLYTYYILSIY